MYKILERNGVDNENIDGAAFNNFAAGERDGIVAGVLSQCSIYYDGSVIGISSGEIIIHGFRIKITEAETISVSSTPVTATKYQIIAQIVCGDNNDVSFSMFVRLPSVLKKDEIFKNNRGTYQMEFGTFVHNPDGRVTELTRTASVFYSDIHNSAIVAEQAAKAAEESAENALIAAEKAVMDIPMSEQQTGTFINGKNTLKSAIAKVEVQSENLFNWKLGYIYEGGITYTENDGIFTANGTAGADVSVAYMASFKDSPIFKKGRYFLSGCPAGGSSSTYYVNIDIRDSTQDRFIKAIYDTGSGAIVDIDEDFTIGVYISIRNYTANNLVFKPKFQAGTVATPYTPYLPENTAVNFTAYRKNLFNMNAIPSNNTAINNGGSVSDSIFVDGKIIINTVSQYNDLWAVNVPIKVKKGQVTLSATVRTPDANYNQISFDLKGHNSVVSHSVFIETNGSEWQNISRTFTVPQDGIVYIHIQNIKDRSGANQIVEFYNVQLEMGDTATEFAPYEGKEYSSQVGKNVDVEQYDGITNIFVTTDGGAVSTKFLLSTNYELEDKVNLLVGTFANRPTATQKYGLIYISTDKNGAERVTYLPPNTDGIVSGNWISFNS